MIAWELASSDDIDAAIQAVCAGKDPTMRRISRARGVHISWLVEACRKPSLKLAYTKPEDMAADVFAKAFNDAPKRAHSCKLVGISA